MALDDNAGEELNGSGRSVLVISQAAPLGRVPSTHLQCRVISLFSGTLSFNGERDGMLAEVPQVGMIYRLSRPVLTEAFDDAFLGSTLVGTDEDTKVHHLSWCLSRLETLENLGCRAPPKVDHIITREPAGSEDLLEDRRMNVPVPGGLALSVDAAFDRPLHKVVDPVEGRHTTRRGAGGFVPVEGISG